MDSKENKVNYPLKCKKKVQAQFQQANKLGKFRQNSKVNLGYISALVYSLFKTTWSSPRALIFRYACSLIHI